MASQFATLTSVKRTLMVSKVLLAYLLKSKNRIQPGQFPANCLTMPYSGLGWKRIRRLGRRNGVE